MLRNIALHGSLRREFGPKFRFDVASPMDVVRALIVQIRGFREHLRDGHFRIVRGKRKSGHDLSLEQLELGLGSAEEIHIVPVVAGASSGLGKILAGICALESTNGRVFASARHSSKAKRDQFRSSLLNRCLLFGHKHPVLLRRRSSFPLHLQPQFKSGAV